MVAINFNAEEHEPRNDFEPLPAGRYHAIIVGTEEKQTRDGAGKYLQVTLQIADGEYCNRKLWEILNLENRNDTAVQIAKATMSMICRAVGVLRMTDTEQLHGIPMQITVAVERDKRTEELRNRIKKYEPINAAAPAAGSPTSRAPAGQPAQQGAPPWRR